MRSSRQFSFLNGPKKLVFVRMYGSTFTGLMGPTYFYCSLVAFVCFLCFFMFFMLLYTLLQAQKHPQAKIN